MRRTKPILPVLLVGFLLLAGCSLYPQISDPQHDTDSTEGQYQGTQWGEGLESRVTRVNLERVSDSPLERSEIYYSASRSPGTAIKEIPMINGRVTFAVLDQDGNKMDLVQHNGDLHLQATAGERYELRLRNFGNRTYEVVSAVDGLDVLNGQPGSLHHRGYVLEPGRILTISGFRRSNTEVAAFRFSSAGDADASNSEQGAAHNLGVLGLAVFELSTPLPPSRAVSTSHLPQAFPADASPVPPPHYDD